MSSFDQFGDISTLKVVDVNAKIELQMIKMIKAVRKAKNKSMDWEKFKHYCYEYFELPMATIERSIIKLQEEMYEDYDREDEE